MRQLHAEQKQPGLVENKLLHLLIGLLQKGATQLPSTIVRLSLRLELTLLQRLSRLECFHTKLLGKLFTSLG